MRGKAGLCLKDGSEVRITPACAGKRGLVTLVDFFGKDHPRVCGEKSLFIRIPLFSLGSPPRVRGKVVGLVDDVPQGRITPACAGKRNI